MNGRTIAFLVAQEGVEEVELTTPREAVEKAGATAHLIAPEAGEVQAFNHLDKEHDVCGRQDGRAGRCRRL